MLLGHVFFLILTRPTPDNKMFPYHVKTNQIGLAKTAEESYPHHPENVGGNSNFDLKDSGISLSSIFTPQNIGQKYQINSNLASEEVKY